MKQEDWENTKGVICEWCRQEAWRLTPFKGMRICPSCLKQINSNDAQIRELRNQFQQIEERAATPSLLYWGCG